MKYSITYKQKQIKIDTKEYNTWYIDLTLDISPTHKNEQIDVEKMQQELLEAIEDAPKQKNIGTVLKIILNLNCKNTTEAINEATIDVNQWLEFKLKRILEEIVEPISSSYQVNIQPTGTDAPIELHCSTIDFGSPKYNVFDSLKKITKKITKNFRKGNCNKRQQIENLLYKLNQKRYTLNSSASLDSLESLESISYRDQIKMLATFMVDQALGIYLNEHHIKYYDSIPSDLDERGINDVRFEGLKAGGKFLFQNFLKILLEKIKSQNRKIKKLNCSYCSRSYGTLISQRDIMGVLNADEFKDLPFATIEIFPSTRCLAADFSLSEAKHFDWLERFLLNNRKLQSINLGTCSFKSQQPIEKKILNETIKINKFLEEAIEGKVTIYSNGEDEEYKGIIIDKRENDKIILYFVGDFNPADCDKAKAEYSVIYITKDSPFYRFPKYGDDDKFESLHLWYPLLQDFLNWCKKENITTAMSCGKKAKNAQPTWYHFAILSNNVIFSNIRKIKKEQRKQRKTCDVATLNPPINETDLKHPDESITIGEIAVIPVEYNHIQQTQHQYNIHTEQIQQTTQQVQTETTREAKGSSNFNELYENFAKRWLDDHLHDAYPEMDDRYTKEKSIDQIVFGSNKKIDYLTLAAIEKIEKHLGFFRGGIKTNLLPKGFFLHNVPFDSLPEKNKKTIEANSVQKKKTYLVLDYDADPQKITQHQEKDASPLKTKLTRQNRYVEPPIDYMVFKNPSDSEESESKNNYGRDYFDLLFETNTEIKLKPIRYTGHKFTKRDVGPYHICIPPVSEITCGYNFKENKRIIEKNPVLHNPYTEVQMQTQHTQDIAFIRKIKDDLIGNIVSCDYIKLLDRKYIIDLAYEIRQTNLQNRRKALRLTLEQEDSVIWQKISKNEWYSTLIDNFSHENINAILPVLLNEGAPGVLELFKRWQKLKDLELYDSFKLAFIDNSKNFYEDFLDNPDIEKILLGSDLDNLSLTQKTWWNSLINSSHQNDVENFPIYQGNFPELFTEFKKFWCILSSQVKDIPNTCKFINAKGFLPSLERILNIIDNAKKIGDKVLNEQMLNLDALDLSQDGAMYAIEERFYRVAKEMKLTPKHFYTNSRDFKGYSISISEMIEKASDPKNALTMDQMLTCYYRYIGKRPPVLEPQQSLENYRNIAQLLKDNRKLKDDLKIKLIPILAFALRGPENDSNREPERWKFDFEAETQSFFLSIKLAKMNVIIEQLYILGKSNYPPTLKEINHLLNLFKKAKEKDITEFFQLNHDLFKFIKDFENATEENQKKHSFAKDFFPMLDDLSKHKKLQLKQFNGRLQTIKDLIGYSDEQKSQLASISAKIKHEAKPKDKFNDFLVKIKALKNSNQELVNHLLDILANIAIKNTSDLLDLQKINAFLDKLKQEKNKKETYSQLKNGIAKVLEGVEFVKLSLDMPKDIDFDKWAKEILKRKKSYPYLNNFISANALKDELGKDPLQTLIAIRKNASSGDVLSREIDAYIKSLFRTRAQELVKNLPQNQAQSENSRLSEKRWEFLAEIGFATAIREGSKVTWENFNKSYQRLIECLLHSIQEESIAHIIEQIHRYRENSSIDGFIKMIESAQQENTHLSLSILLQCIFSHGEKLSLENEKAVLKKIKQVNANQKYTPQQAEALIKIAVICGNENRDKLRQIETIEMQQSAGLMFNKIWHLSKSKTLDKKQLVESIEQTSRLLQGSSITDRHILDLLEGFPSIEAYSKIAKKLSEVDVEKLTYFMRILLGSMQRTNLSDFSDEKTLIDALNTLLEALKKLSDVNLQKLAKIYESNNSIDIFQLNKKLASSTSENDLTRLIDEYKQNPYPNRDTSRESYFDKEELKSLIRKIKYLETGKNIQSQLADKLVEYFAYINDIGFKIKVFKNLKNEACAIVDLSDKEIESEINKCCKIFADEKSQQNDQLKAKLRFLALAREMMRRITGKLPRDIQMVSVLLATIFNKGNPVLLGIKTGEGKTLITALIQVFNINVNRNSCEHLFSNFCTENMALAGDAKRELNKFYHFFDITSSLAYEDGSANAGLPDGIVQSTPSDLCLNHDQSRLTEKVPAILKAGGLYGALVLDEADATLHTPVKYNSSRSPKYERYKNPYEWIYPLIINFVKQNGGQNLKKCEAVKNLKAFLQKECEIDNCQAGMLQYISDTQLLTWIKCAGYVRTLKEGKDFVVTKEQREIQGKIESISVVKLVIENRISEAILGNGGQQFLTILLRDTYKDTSKARFIVEREIEHSLSRTSLDLLYKTHVNGGSIVMVTGSPDVEHRFKNLKDSCPPLNHLQGFDIPRWQVPNLDEQITYLVDDENARSELIAKIVARESKDGHPILIEHKDVNSSHDLYQKFLKKEEYASYTKQLLNAKEAQKDGKEISSDNPELDIKNQVGKSNTLTFSTDMLARGANLLLEDKDKKLILINSAFSTRVARIQKYGRVRTDGKYYGIYTREEIREILGFLKDETEKAKFKNILKQTALGKEDLKFLELQYDKVLRVDEKFREKCLRTEVLQPYQEDFLNHLQTLHYPLKYASFENKTKLERHALKTKKQHRLIKIKNQWILLRYDGASAYQAFDITKNNIYETEKLSHISLDDKSIEVQIYNDSAIEIDTGTKKIVEDCLTSAKGIQRQKEFTSSLNIEALESLIYQAPRDTKKRDEALKNFEKFIKDFEEEWNHYLGERLACSSAAQEQNDDHEKNFKESIEKCWRENSLHTIPLTYKIKQDIPEKTEEEQKIDSWPKITDVDAKYSKKLEQLCNEDENKKQKEIFKNFIKKIKESVKKKKSEIQNHHEKINADHSELKNKYAKKPKKCKKEYLIKYKDELAVIDTKQILEQRNLIRLPNLDENDGRNLESHIQDYLKQILHLMRRYERDFDKLYSTFLEGYVESVQLSKDLKDLIIRELKKFYDEELYKNPRMLNPKQFFALHRKICALQGLTPSYKSIKDRLFISLSKWLAENSDAKTKLAPHTFARLVKVLAWSYEDAVGEAAVSADQEKRESTIFARDDKLVRSVKNALDAFAKQKNITEDERKFIFEQIAKIDDLWFENIRNNTEQEQVETDLFVSLKEMIKTGVESFIKQKNISEIEKTSFKETKEEFFAEIDKSKNDDQEDSSAKSEQKVDCEIALQKLAFAIEAYKLRFAEFTAKNPLVDFLDDMQHYIEAMLENYALENDLKEQDETEKNKKQKVAFKFKSMLKSLKWCLERHAERIENKWWVFHPWKNKKHRLLKNFIDERFSEESLNEFCAKNISRAKSDVENLSLEELLTRFVKEKTIEDQSAKNITNTEEKPNEEKRGSANSYNLEKILKMGTNLSLRGCLFWFLEKLRPVDGESAKKKKSGLKNLLKPVQPFFKKLLEKIAKKLQTTSHHEVEKLKRDLLERINDGVNKKINYIRSCKNILESLKKRYDKDYKRIMKNPTVIEQKQKTLEKEINNFENRMDKKFEKDPSSTIDILRAYSLFVQKLTTKKEINASTAMIPVGKSLTVEKLTESVHSKRCKT